MTQAMLMHIPIVHPATEHQFTSRAARRQRYVEGDLGIIPVRRQVEVGASTAVANHEGVAAV